MAHRQEITCVRFLDPLPCLATADMTGKVLLWATRPHENGGTLLIVLRNTVMTAGDQVPEVAPGLSGRRLARARGQRKVLPTAVTCIAFRHRKPSESDPTEAAAAAQRARQNEQTAVELKAATAAAEGSKHEHEKQSIAGHEKPKVTTAPSPWEVGSILFTGDELGSIKVWDLTDVFLDKLGPTACGAKATEDKATVPPASFGAASHHFIHYRQGPLDGVGLQAAVRFRELIDIARVLRRGEHLQTAKPETDSSDTSLRRAGLDGGGRGRGAGKKIKRSEAKSSASSLSTGSSTAERSRDRSSAGRRKQELGPDPKSGQAGRSSGPLPASGAAPDAWNVKQRHGAPRPVGPKEQAEATLNAIPDDIHPVASWTGHKDCVTSMQTIPSPLSILTGSLDSSARLFSLDGSLLGAMSEKQNDRETERAWAFQPPAKGRNTEASARAAALEKTLKDVRHEERQPARSGASGTTAPPEDTPGEVRCTLSSRPSDMAPNHGSELGTTFAGSKRHRASPLPGDSDSGDGASLLAANAVDEGVEEERGEITLERRNCLQAQSAISAVCLSRISELAQGRIAEVAASSDTWSDNPLRTAEYGIEARLLSEAREGREYQRRGVSVRQASSDDNEESQGKRAGFHHVGRSSNVASDPPPAPKLPPNLTAERERKEARRTRSTVQFLSNSLNHTNGGPGSVSSFCPCIKSQSKKAAVEEGPRVTGRTQGDGSCARIRPFTSPGTRSRSPDKNKSKFLVRDGSATTLPESTGLSPAAKLRHAVMVASPYLALRLERNNSNQLPPSNQGSGEENQAGVDGGGRTGRREAGGDDRGVGGTSTPKNERAKRREATPVTRLAAMPPAQRFSAARMVVLTQRSTANMLFTQRSTATLASARSNRSNKSCVSMTRPVVSTKTAVARRMAADRRLRRMDGILDGVRRLGHRETASRRWSLVSRAGDGDVARSTVVEETQLGDAKAGGRGAGAGGGAVMVSARVREVLSRFERSVNGGGEDDQEDIEFNNQADQRARLMRRQLEARTAARQEAIRHNDRYRRAQRYDLVTLQETQLRRQEAMVGLAGPSGERFGPYT